MKPRGKAARRGQRSGFTTGACGAAAARAATLGWLSGQLPAQVEATLPNGQLVVFPVAAGEVDPLWATAVVIKDAGDDPDCTHGAHLTALVRPLPGRAGEIPVLGGEGVGLVTQPGLGLPLGEAAINPIPRRNIADNVRAVAGRWLAQSGLEITLSVPGGAALAKRTLNPRLGIVGGISILGTTGIVYPYSTAAFKAAMGQTIQSAVLQGATTLVLTTGRRSERFAMQHRPDLPAYAFIQMGDFIGAALEKVGTMAIPALVVAVMVGKLAKIGQGLANTHAHKGSIDMEWIAQLAAAVGGSKAICQQIRAATTVRYAAELLATQGLERPFIQALLHEAAQAIIPRLPTKTHITLLAFNFDGTLLESWMTPASASSKGF